MTPAPPRSRFRSDPRPWRSDSRRVCRMPRKTAMGEPPMPSWSAEQTVSAARAIQLIEEQFPDLAPARVELFGEGWDNFAFKVNGQFVFRFPRRQIAAELIEIECGLLPKLAPRVTLPVPAPQFLGHATSQYP